MKCKNVTQNFDILTYYAVHLEKRTILTIFITINKGEKLYIYGGVVLKVGLIRYSIFLCDIKLNYPGSIIDFKDYTQK